MDSKDFNRNICRICLDSSVDIDWNSTLYGYHNVTYKDCFYKYTQLECLAPDLFSPMLCENCANGLHNVHTLILKAIESDKYFQSNNSVELADDVEYTTTEFQVVLLDNFVYDTLNEETIRKPTADEFEKKFKRCKDLTSLTLKNDKCKNEIGKSLELGKKILKRTQKVGSDVEVHNSEYKIKKTYKKPEKTIQESSIKHDNEEPISGCDETRDQENSLLFEDDLLDNVIKTSNNQVNPKLKKRTNRSRMCSFCSKILHGKAALEKHEETHMDNRERKETCKVCGLKFYDKYSLHTHMPVHGENRKKNQKCEFCNKAFYYKGDLNVHRRIHLGEMISCSLCTKQFYKQVQLEAHMMTHSAATINMKTKKKPKYLVRCKYCDKSILSTSYRSHTAAHLNEPLMKCSICDREFFRRSSCVLHVKKIHKKTNDYKDFIIQYEENRMSHLFMEQKADMQIAEELQGD